MTGQCVGKGSRSNVTQTDLNICTPSSNKHVRCCNWRHGCSIDFSWHLKIHDNLRKQNNPHKNSEHQDFETERGNRKIGD